MDNTEHNQSDALLLEWYSHSEQLLDLIDEFTGHEIMAPDTPHDKEVAKIVAFRFIQAIRTFRSVLIISREGDGSNSFTLMRMLFEGLVDVAYLIHNPKDVWRYLEDAADLETKLRKAAHEYGLPPKDGFEQRRPSPEALRGQFHQLAEEHSTCKSWRRLNLKARAEKTGYPDIVAMYEIIYPTASAYIHGASGILLDYLRGHGSKETELRVDYEKTDKEVEPAVGISAMVFLRFVAFLDALFKFGLRNRVEKLRDKQQILFARSQRVFAARFGS